MLSDFFVEAKVTKKAELQKSIQPILLCHKNKSLADSNII